MGLSFVTVVQGISGTLVIVVSLSARRLAAFETRLNQEWTGREPNQSWTIIKYRLAIPALLLAGVWYMQPR